MACVERVYFDCWEEDVEEEEEDVGLVVPVVLGISGMRWLVVSLVSCGIRRESVVVTVGVAGVVRMDGVAVVLSSTNPVVDVVVEREDPPRKEASCRRNGE